MKRKKINFKEKSAKFILNIYKRLLKPQQKNDIKVNLFRFFDNILMTTQDPKQNIIISDSPV